MSSMRNIDLNQLKTVKDEMTRFLMAYKFALDEMGTKINILQQEFEYIHEYNPIEHTKSRLKEPESILKKVMRKNHSFSIESIKENIQDIAGIRITCSFISDIYVVADMLKRQKDIVVLETKDYIKNPKPNGYQSLHLILQVPVYMSDREELVSVEVQIRTIAMDFWASLEHKIYYKFNKEIPVQLSNELKTAATTAAALDRKMEQLHKEVSEIKKLDEDENLNHLLDIFGVEGQRLQIPNDLIKKLEGITEGKIKKA
ncbi:GTP pyrophosphokinase [Alkalihalobacillus alcalophilus ATCC 27647 = CGMCC 1.3604]|uniref:GTP pyrophosphokinase n=1 Tax=Alkalihalobacillus alcalophilus ATCC 27647 = CGMCC 1.3604 TaxID=1218173 RepID=A0A094WHZ0_ALKAL|nr:GTP pyrophosphokinase [Alkalihalobacillus alcalophilus ATCC 27647 = CGMCC 1.3604]THG88827.1 GTP pyrophosphokinase [Alkalihalobacillus alcalophilus ATCC 27647 = CGMCC 1.3604]